MSGVHHEVVIVGGGFSGIGMAIALRRAGFDDLLIVDDASEPGGVWHWNTYPGVAVDIPSFSYQFSFHQQSDWSRTYAKGAELKEYAARCVEEFGLADLFRLNTRVTEAVFDEDARLWRVATSGGDLTARYLVHAGGPLSQPKRPDIDGLDDFAGTVMHTSRWDHGVALAGQRVGIIGTGASAVQIIPEIAPETARLTVFQRTPIWCLPKADVPLAAPARVALEKAPGAKRIARFASDAYVEAMFPFIAHFHGLLPVTKAVEPLALAYLRSQVRDPETRDRLTPRYGLGCKRPSFHNSYLSTFNRDDVALETGSIERVTAEGVVTSDGTVHELDVLLLATGFKVTDKDALPSYRLTGAGGVDLGDWWDEHRLQAYQGVSVRGFPNFFTMFGPYAYNGSSFFTLIEAASAHITRVLRHADRTRATRVEVTAAAHDAFFAEMMRRRGRQVFWQDSCRGANSYYFSRHGDVPLRPALTPEVRWRNRRVPMSDYSFSR
ncbi:MAG: NAD(P)/FAD-dependent oxidoreductase [Aeromicrobium sp.]|uniref:flavin-containing monooxygenase n=1 Tax=Aeromicrobium sp. TaxID=1871063 RepID=UPI0039E58576